MNILNNLAHVVARLECINEKGLISLGTGFFFSIHENNETNVPILVTNKHVIKNSVYTIFRLSQKDNNGNPQPKEFLEIKLPSAQIWKNHPDENIDLCATTFGNILNGNLKNKNVIWARITANLIPTEEHLSNISSVEDVIMVDILLDFGIVIIICQFFEKELQPLIQVFRTMAKKNS